MLVVLSCQIRTLFSKMQFTCAAGQERVAGLGHGPSSDSLAVMKPKH